MTATNYNPAACGATYEECLNLIRHTVHRFRRKFGGEFDELMSEASPAYMSSYAAFCRGEVKCDFSTAVQRNVWCRLLDAHRSRTHSRAAERPPAVSSLNHAGDDGKAHDPVDYRAPIDVDPGREWVAEFVSDLADDAAAVVRMIFDAPAELLAVAEAKGETPRNVLSTIRAWLVEQAGWDSPRAAAAFDEVRDALGGKHYGHRRRDNPGLVHYLRGVAGPLPEVQ